MRILRRFFQVSLAVPAFLACASSEVAATPPAECRPLQQPRVAAVVSVDSVEWREDLSRVYCRIIGMPHTSERVDAVRMTVGKRRLDATDIDGIDFRRYFQWEDDGSILLEIDFPPVSISERGNFSLTFDTVHGEVKSAL